MEKLKLRPNRDSYSVTDGTTFKQTKLEGGASRFRRDLLGAARTVDVSWLLNPSQYRYFTAFYNTTLKDGSESFKIDLLLDNPRLTEHVAHFIQDTKKLDGQSGLAHTVSAQLEVMPIRTNPDLDDAIVAAFDADEKVDTNNISVVYPEIEIPIDIAIQAFAFNFPWIAEDGVTVIDQTGKGNHGTLVGDPDEIAAFVESGILGLSPQFAVSIAGLIGFDGNYKHRNVLSDPLGSVIIEGRRTHSIQSNATEGISIMTVGTDFDVT
jgi:hypothetical protein